MINSIFSFIYFFYIANLRPFFGYFFYKDKTFVHYKFLSSQITNSHEFKNSYFAQNYNFYENFKHFNFIKNFKNYSNVSNFYSYYNFNSHITYAYVMFNLLIQVPLFVLNSILNIFNFKEMSSLVHNVENTLIT